MQRDDHGRRIFRTIERAFKAQKFAALKAGVYSGVIRIGDGTFVLLHDPESE